MIAGRPEASLGQHDLLLLPPSAGYSDTTVTASVRQINKAEKAQVDSVLQKKLGLEE